MKTIIRNLLLLAMVCAVASGMTAQAGEIHDAVGASDLAKVKQLLQAKPELANQKDRFNRMPLHYAVYRGIELIEMLLACKADVNAQDGQGNTPLHVAAYHSPKTIAELLLAHGARINARGFDDQTPLCCAAYRGNMDVVELLLAHGAEINAKDKSGSTPLDIARQCHHNKVVAFLRQHGGVSGLLMREGNIADAARTGDVAMVEKLLAAKPELLNAKFDDGFTLLLLAGKEGQMEMVKFLLSRKVDLEAKDGQCRTLLNWASTRGYRDLAELLLKKRVDVNSRDDQGYTALSWAAFNGDTGMAKLLLDRKADINVIDNSGNAPLHWAVSSFPKPEMVKLLLARHANVNIKNKDSLETPLHEAVHFGNDEAVRLLLAHKADVNARKWDGSTPLDVATSPSTIALLRKHGGIRQDGLCQAIKRGDLAEARFVLNAKPDFVFEYHTQLAMASGCNTPLDLAVQHGNKEMVKLLLHYKADPTVKGALPGTAIGQAIEQNRRDLVEVMLACKWNINDRCCEGCTPLQYAIRKGNKDIAELLLKHKADPNIKMLDGETVLHSVVCGRTRELAEMLLAYKADVNAKDANGQTPLDIARQMEDRQYDAKPKEGTEWVGMLLKHGGKGEIEARREKEAGRVRLWLAGQQEPVSEKTAAGGALLQWAASVCSTQLTQMLLAGKIDANVKDAGGCSPLHSAAAYNPERMKWHAEAYTGVKNNTNIVLTPQLWAAVANPGAEVELLLSYRADIHARDSAGGTPLHAAAQFGTAAAAQRLLKRGARANARDNDGRTPLHWTRAKDVAEALIARKADVNARDNEGRTSLYWALEEPLLDRGEMRWGERKEKRESRIGALKLLVANKADVNSRAKDGSTPLHAAAAAFWDTREIIELLLTHHADVNARDANGRTPLD
ncbi:MAG: ankyrin repeat domain-containing protein, partial [Verrucomicrobiia bacterium]